MTTEKRPCEQTERVADYALRVLPTSEHAAFAAHVAQCATCQHELAAFAPVADGLADWPVDVLRPPTPLWDRLAQRIGAPAGEPSGQEHWVDEPAWKNVAPGISVKILATNEETGGVSMLVHLEPNAEYPPHRHAGVEELHLLDGELWIDDRKLYPGEYSRAEPGTGDKRVWSETGCTCVLMTSTRDVLG